MASFTSASDRRPFPRSFLKAAASFSVSPSNAMGSLLQQGLGLFHDLSGQPLQLLVVIAGG